MTHAETIVDVIGVRTAHLVEELNLSIRRNEIHALMGPQGSGKSTIIKILSGLTYPTEGSVRVMGFVPWKEPEKCAAKIGVVLSRNIRPADRNTVMNVFERCKEMFSISESRFSENLSFLVDYLDLEGVVQRPVHTLTPGQVLRCEIACALLHDPELVFLDEPAPGVDRDTGRTIWRLIKKINRERHVTFIIATRDLDEIRNLCDRVSVIQHGKIVYSDRVENLKMYRSQANMIEVIISEEPDRFGYGSQVSGNRDRCGYLRPCTAEPEILKDSLFKEHRYN
jgi:ABC-2 type transport system ATP-binding protein